VLLPGAVTLVVSAVALVTVSLGATSAVGAGIPVEWRTTVGCIAVLVAALVLGRSARSTVVAPVVALLAAQPLLPLLLSAWREDLVGGLAGVLGTVLLDVVVLVRLRGVAADVAEVVMRLGVALAAPFGMLVAWVAPTAESWTATGLLAAAGAVVLLLRRHPRLAPRLPVTPLLAGTAAVVGLALAGSLAHSS
jgi:hypothetical protein